MSLQSSKLERTLGALGLGGAVAGEINFEQIVSPGASTAATQAVAAPAITPRFAGQMKVDAGMTVTASTPGTIVTFTLQRGSTVIAQRRSTSGASGLANAAFSMFDPILQTAATVYEILATPAAGTVAIASLEGSCTVTESGA